MELEQKKPFIRKHFKLLEDEIQVYDKSLSTELEYSVNYLDLGVQVVRKSVNNRRFIEFFFLAFSMMYVVLLFHTMIFEPEITMLITWAFAFALFFSFYLLVKFSEINRTILLTGGQKGLEFIANKPESKIVEDFVTETVKRIKAAYLKEYFNWEKDATTEMKKQQLDWLNRIKILSKEEANQLLFGDDGQTKREIGFK